MRDEYDFSKMKRRPAKDIKVAKYIKVIKTFRLDVEVIEWLEREAHEQGMGYQTFLNWFLRKNISGQETIEERLAKLEKAVFKKK